MKVFIGPAPLRDYEHAFVPALAAAGHDVIWGPKAHLLNTEQLLAVLPGCDASLAGSEPYTPEVIAAAAAKGLKVIARAGVGYDAINVEAATKHGIPVCITPGANDGAVAELAWTHLLALAKSLFFQDKENRLGTWPRIAVDNVRGRTLGIIGLGRTGKATVRRAAGFDVKVLAYDIVIDREFVAKHNVELATHPDEVFKRADFLSLHVPLTPQTKQMVNARTLGLMKPASFLINTSRGPVVDEAALFDALKAKRIAGAGLDVFENEPLKAGHPFGTLDNIILTAHTAGVDKQSRLDMAAAAAHAIVTLLKGEWLPDGWVMNPEVKAAFLTRHRQGERR
jgi:D-3-phosphoglycerate dehydrogenase / 2-oxoglutarate reductase